MQNLYFYLILLFSTFLSTFIVTKLIIPKLKKIAKQPIYDDGPKWHIKKNGTPTMGGIGFIIPSLILMLVGVTFSFSNPSSQVSLSLLISAVFCLLNALVGVWDDITKIKRSKNAGLTPMQKLILQGLIAVAFLIVRKRLIGDETIISLGNLSLDLGWLYYPLSLLFILGIINCSNLTDGIDGLEASVSFAIAVSTFFISMRMAHDAQILSSIGIGAALGFLCFNIHPAKIFMGDTGSLGTGALLATVSLFSGNMLNFLIIGIVYVVSGVSVILQVGYYKVTHKRIFKMAPLHHHLERCGIHENKIVAIYALVTLCCAIAVISLRG